MQHWLQENFYDECGIPHYCVDETLRRRLETKLITKILAFEVGITKVGGVPFRCLTGVCVHEP